MADGSSAADLSAASVADLDEQIMGCTGLPDQVVPEGEALQVPDLNYPHELADCFPTQLGLTAGTEVMPAPVVLGLAAGTPCVTAYAETHDLSREDGECPVRLAGI